nr:hypothetical protein [Arenimonas daejeonensis]
MRVLTVTLLFLALVLCAAPAAADPTEHEIAIAGLLDDLQALDSDPSLADLAGLERLKARQAVTAAQNAKRKDREHRVTLAERWIAAARLAAEAELLEGQSAQLDRERDQIMVEASRRDAERARREADRLRLQSLAREEAAEREALSQTAAWKPPAPKPPRPASWPRRAPAKPSSPARKPNSPPPSPPTTSAMPRRRRRVAKGAARSIPWTATLSAVAAPTSPPRRRPACGPWPASFVAVAEPSRSKATPTARAPMPPTRPCRSGAPRPCAVCWRMPGCPARASAQAGGANRLRLPTTPRPRAAHATGGSKSS